MAIYPGGKVKNSGSSTNEDPRFTEMLQEAPKREVFVQDNNGDWLGTGMLMLSDNTLLAPEGFGAESGSVKFGDLINLSEASGYLAIYNYLEQSQFQMVDYHVPKDSPTSKPTYVWLYEAENEFVAQAVTNTNLNANPLVFSYTTQLQSRVNAIKFKAYQAMTNVRVKITDVDANVVVKYYPSKGSWSGDSQGVNFVVGDNLVDFGDSPLLFSPGTTLQYEITADNVRIQGNASGIPYLAGMLQRGVTITLADQNDIAAVQSAMFSGNYNDLTNLPVIPDSSSQLINDAGFITAGQAPVQSVNGQVGNVTIAVPASQVNSDWNATSGVAQILNKPILFDGTYNSLTNKPIIPTNTNQLTNGSGYVNAAQAATASPVQSVNGQTGIVTLTIPSAQIQSDWNQSNIASLDYIKNKPTIPSLNYPVTSVNTKTGAVVLSASDVGAIAVGASIPYSTLTGTPTIPAGQVNSDWNSTSGITQILNKPATFTPSAHTQAWSTITATPTTLSGYGITDAYPLSANPAGYLTGITSAQVTTALGYTPYNGTTNPNGYVTQAGARSAISLTTTGTIGAATYNSTTGVLNVPNYSVSARTFTNPTRTLNTAFQISTTQDAQVTYAVDITVSALLIGGSSGRVYLEYATDSGFTTGVTTVTSSGNSTGGVLSITNVGTANLNGIIPAGRYVRLRTVNVTATPTFAFQSAQEVLL